MATGVEQYRRKEKLKHATKLIRREVGYFNGWRVSDEQMDRDCENAAKKVIRYLKQYDKRRS